VRIRQYLPEDGSATLEVFLRAVRETASSDYSEREIAAWAPEDIDLAAWSRTRAAADTRVALIGDEVVGFIDLMVSVADIDGLTAAAESGHIDMLFVDPSFGRRGIASALFDSVLANARSLGMRALTVEASRTARPFFARNGFELVEAQRVERDGVFLTRFRMRRAAG